MGAIKTIVEAIFSGNIPDKNDYGRKKDGKFTGVKFTFDRTKNTGKIESIKNLIKNTDKDSLYPFVVKHVEKEDDLWEEHIHVRIINPEQLVEISSWDCSLDEFIKYLTK